MFSIFYGGKGGGGYVVVSGQWSVASGMAAAAGGRQERSEQQIPRRLKPARDNDHRGLGLGTEAPRYPKSLREDSVVPENVGVAATRLPFLLSVTRGLRPGLTSRPPLRGSAGALSGIFLAIKLCAGLRDRSAGRELLLFRPAFPGGLLTSGLNVMGQKRAVHDGTRIDFHPYPAFRLRLRAGLDYSALQAGCRRRLDVYYLRTFPITACSNPTQEKPTANSEQRVAKRGRLRPRGCHAG